MFQLISTPTAPHIPHAIPIRQPHPPPQQIILTHFQTEYILLLYFDLHRTIADIAHQVNLLWGSSRKGSTIRMSPQDVSDILIEAEEQSRYSAHHPYHFYANPYFAALMQHRWRLSRAEEMARAREAEQAVFGERPRMRKRGCTVS
ncbi:MAG: hypothetical protein LQ349_005630 [Xanthoria aureola]|nr:MAG: hypothetical protein LQ349_005630 [Xanthoria aureola]